MIEKVAAPVKKTELTAGDPLRWPRDTLYPQKLAQFIYKIINLTFMTKSTTSEMYPRIHIIVNTTESESLL
jgi:hypothetical protein